MILVLDTQKVDYRLHFYFLFELCLVELKYLSEPLEMQYEHIRQRPQAELNAALLQLLAVGTAPGIIWGQLKHTQPRKQPSRASPDHTAYEMGLA